MCLYSQLSERIREKDSEGELDPELEANLSDIGSHLKRRKKGKDQTGCGVIPALRRWKKRARSYIGCIMSSGLAWDM